MLYEVITIELCLDEADRVWIMLHSGSRGDGPGQFSLIADLRITSYNVCYTKLLREKYWIR